MSHGGYSSRTTTSVWRQDISQQSILKRTCVIYLTVFALFLGIVGMFFFIESSEARSEKALRQIYTPAQQVDLFIKSVRTQPLIDSLEELTKQNHTAGMPGDNATAHYVADLWRSYGIPLVNIERFDVLLSYPDTAQLQLLVDDGAAETLDIKEKVHSQSGTTVNPPVWNGFSASGDVTAPLVYVNYGHLDDFHWENIKDIVNGSIVIVRYGQGFRGNKVLDAERYGAVGCLIYSDPYDDGFLHGPVYPNGPWRSKDSVQRGAVAIPNGDLTTPGFASRKGAPRTPINKLRATYGEGDTAQVPIPTIPVLPISWRNAEKLMKNLEGAQAPDAWRGGIRDLPYRVGGTNKVRVRLNVKMREPITPVWNVVARIDGSETDAPVILGNHRDAWTFGAVDPSSGSTVLNEVARVLGEMHADGWRPKRTIMLCSWDAEEQGLIGSTEFVERRRVDLMRQAILYLNVDSACAGHTRFKTSAVPSIAPLFREIAALIPYKVPPGTPPQATYADDADEATEQAAKNFAKELEVSWKPFDTLLDFWKHTQLLTEEGTTPNIPEGVDMPYVPPLGSGSDFAPMLQLAGIPAIDFMFEFSTGYGVYHSNDDNFDWMKRFGDPGFTRHHMMAQLFGATAIRFADDDVLPYNYNAYSKELNRYITLVKKYATSAYSDASKELDDSVWTLLDAAAKHFDKACVFVSQLQATPDLPAVALRSLNRRLAIAERAFLDRRNLFKEQRHILFRSAADNAYASQPLPSLYSAVRQSLTDQPDANGYTGTDLLLYEVQALSAAIAEVAALLDPDLLLREETVQPEDEL